MKCWRCNREMVTGDGRENLCGPCRDEISATRIMRVDYTTPPYTEDDPLVRRSEVEAMIDKKLREFANNPLGWASKCGPPVPCGGTEQKGGE